MPVNLNILISEHMFTDDIAFVANNYQDASKIIIRFSKSAKALINLEKKTRLCSNSFRDVMTYIYIYI